MTLDRDAAERAIERHVAEPLGLELHEAAEGDHRGRQREHGRRGAADLDPPRLRPARVRARRLRRRGPAARRRAGAGSCRSRRCSCRRSPGITSALGCLIVDIRHDLSEMFLRPAADADPASSRPSSRRSRHEARELLAAEGVPADADAPRALDRHALPRPVALARGRLSTARSTSDAAVERFHAEHEREFSYRRDDAPVELYRLQRARRSGVTPKAELPRHEPTRRRLPEPARRAPRAFFEPARPVDTPVYARDDLPAGVALRGPGGDRPARHDDARPARVRAEVDEWLNIRMDDSEAAHERPSPTATRSIPSPSRCSRTRS